jgi:HrpA-like RNA helicase
VKKKMKELPILKYKQKIIDAVANNQVTIVVGETGSGKTTQIPQFLYEAEYGSCKGKIGITQPRRVAAISVAYFIASQLRCVLGGKVGYKIRFDDRLAKIPSSSL